MKTVLLIDDDENFRSVLADWLAFESYLPITAEDGMHGVQLARQYCPNLIFCDVNMPRMNGFEVLKRLHNDSYTAHIPFFFLTSEPNLKLKTLQQLGASGLIQKPFDVGELRQALVVATVSP